MTTLSVAETQQYLATLTPEASPGTSSAKSWRLTPFEKRELRLSCLCGNYLTNTLV
jgi:hypothetical protein